MRNSLSGSAIVAYHFSPFFQCDPLLEYLENNNFRTRNLVGLPYSELRSSPAIIHSFSHQGRSSPPETIKHLPLFQKNFETVKKNFASYTFSCDFSAQNCQNFG